MQSQRQISENRRNDRGKGCIQKMIIMPNQKREKKGHKRHSGLYKERRKLNQARRQVSDRCEKEKWKGYVEKNGRQKKNWKKKREACSSNDSHRVESWGSFRFPIDSEAPQPNAGKGRRTIVWCAPSQAHFDQAY